MDRKRIQYLDVARGIAMISIVLGHLGNNAFNRVVFTYHLPIFYLISGYFFDTKSSVGRFILKKARRLLVPYYFACLLYCLTSIVINRNYYHTDWRAVMPDNLFSVLYAAGDNWSEPYRIVSIGMLWFLWAAFWGEVFLKLLLKCHYIIRVAAVVGLLLVCCNTWERIWLPLSIQASGSALLYMYLGYLLRRELSEIRAVKLSNELKVAGMALALAVWLWTVHTFKGFWLVHSYIGNGMTDIIGSLCGCCILIVLSRAIQRWIPVLRSFLAFLGRYSLLFLTFHSVEARWIPHWDFYPRFTEFLRLTPSDSLFWAYLIGCKLLFIIICMLLTFYLPPIRAIYGYPPLRRNRKVAAVE